MTAKKHARLCSYRSLFGAAILIAGIAACEQETNPAPVDPTAKARTPDKTEVKMEVSTVDTSTPPSPGPGGVGTSSPSSGAGASTGGKSDPSEDPNIGGPQDPVVDKAIAPIRPILRKCYKKALSTEPTLGGNATFDATLAKDGKVTNVRFVKRDGLNEDMVGCLLTALKHVTFEPIRQTQIVTFSFGSPPTAGATGADAGTKR